jgi:GNAT superfamily N-acetyltransferase
VDPALVRIERATDLPVEAVVRLYRDGGWWHEGDDPAAIPVLLAGSWCVAAAWAGDELVGMGRVISDGISDAYIQDVVVRAEARGQGIGGRIVSFLRDACIDGGILWVGLIAQPGTQDFYRRLGFRAMERHVPMLLWPQSDGKEPA